jgi:predicted small lipoprotein YifL
MKKKVLGSILALALLLIAVFALSACGGKTTEER